MLSNVVLVTGVPTVPLNDVIITCHNSSTACAERPEIQPSLFLMILVQLFLRLNTVPSPSGDGSEEVSEKASEESVDSSFQQFPVGSPVGLKEPPFTFPGESANVPSKTPLRCGGAAPCP